jgi:hypothetical protein
MWDPHVITLSQFFCSFVFSVRAQSPSLDRAVGLLASRSSSLLRTLGQRHSAPRVPDGCDVDGCFPLTTISPFLPSPSMTVACASSLNSNYSFLNLRAALRPSAALALPVSVFIRFFSTVSSVPASPLMEFEAFISLEIHNASISHQICVSRASFLLPFHHLYKKSSMPFFCLQHALHPASSVRVAFLCVVLLVPRSPATARHCVALPLRQRSSHAHRLRHAGQSCPHCLRSSWQPLAVASNLRSSLEPCARHQDLAPEPTRLASPFAGALSAGVELPCTRSSVFGTHL